MKKVRNRTILIVVAAIVAVLVGVRVRSIMNVSLKSEAAETRLQLEAMAEQDMAPLREEIDLKRSIMSSSSSDNGSEYEEAEEEVLEEPAVSAGDVTSAAISDIPSVESLKGYDFKEIFSGSVVVGNSFAGGLESYGVLNSSEVVYKNGASIFNSESLVETAAGLNPSTVFLVFGLNDIDAYEYNLDLFKDDYNNFLAGAAAMMPNAGICSILILPVQDFAGEKHEYYKYLDRYNQAIIDCCEAQGASYMDLSTTYTDDYYSTDGIHPKEDYYYIWAYCMAKGMGLI